MGMQAEILGQVGPQVVSDGANSTFRQGKSAEQIIQQLHARFYEENYRNNLFTFGISSTALAAANAIATGLTSTAQPVIGLWNPATSPVNLVIIKAIVGITVLANSAVNPGGFMWLSATGQSLITTGSIPFSCKTLAQSGSFAKAFAMATALTGLSGSLSAIRAASLGTFNAVGPATAAPQAIGGQLEEIVDGAFIVPPGGVIAVMNQLSTTTVNLNSGILWAEVPI